PEAQPETVQAKKELPPEVVEQQEVVAQEAIQRARANNLTAQHVDTLEQSGAISQTHAQELRVMLDNQRILTAANTANDVNNEVINGRKRDRSIDSMVGLNNYADILDTAIDTGDTKTLGKFMGYLERFAANRANKSAAISEALLQNPSNDNPIYIVPDKSGNWRVGSGLVKGNQELFKAGAFQVWQNNNTNNAVVEESKLTNALLNNYQQIIALRQQNGLLSDFTQQAAQPTHNTQVKPSKFADDPLLVSTQDAKAVQLTEDEQSKVKEYQATYDKQLSDWSLGDFSNVGITISDTTGSTEVNDTDLATVKDTITQGLKEGKSSTDIVNDVQTALGEQGKTVKSDNVSNLETYIKYQQSKSKSGTSSTTVNESKAGNKNKDGKLHQPKKGSRVRIDGTNVVYQNQADSVNYKPETNNEILVGREYEFSTKANAKSGKPSLKPTANSGLAIFTKDGKLATGESAKGKFFDLSRINEPGALGNPFTSLASAQTITDENGKQVPN
ncbi:hypothetical protein IH776_27140, partial [Escherichia coli]|nr:hypothetical protein [Escherichia coli]